MRIDNDISSYLVSQRSMAPTARNEPSPPPDASSGSGADKVSISDAARQAAAKAPSSSGQAPEHPSITYQKITLRDAKADPAYARKAAYEFAHNDSYALIGPMVDITQDPIRYSATGEVVTDASLAAFKAQASQARDELIQLYDAEKARGTPDAEILEKLFRARDEQPESYLQKLNWARAAHVPQGA